MDFKSHDFKTRDGLKLYFRSYGEGDQVVLCLHGLTRNSRDFHELALELSARDRVICPDMRGRGQSDRDPQWDRYHAWTYVDDMWQLMDHLGIERMAIIGTSMGGLMGMIMAAQLPERIVACVINDIGPEISPEGLQRVVPTIGAATPVGSWQEAIDHVREAYEIALPDLPTSFWKSYARHSYREIESGEIVPAMDPNVGRAIREIDSLKQDPWQVYRSVQAPCLLLHGELSDILSPEIIEKMRAAKPALEVVTIPNRGHAPLLNEPESLEAILAFLTRHLDKPRG